MRRVATTHAILERRSRNPGEKRGTVSIAPWLV
jgi:hypothetical protein